MRTIICILLGCCLNTVVAQDHVYLDATVSNRLHMDISVGLFGETPARLRVGVEPYASSVVSINTFLFVAPTFLLHDTVGSVIFTAEVGVGYGTFMGYISNFTKDRTASSQVPVWTFPGMLRCRVRGLLLEAEAFVAKFPEEVGGELYDSYTARMSYRLGKRFEPAVGYNTAMGNLDLQAGVVLWANTKDGFPVEILVAPGVTFPTRSELPAPSDLNLRIVLNTDFL